MQKSRPRECSGLTNQTQGFRILDHLEAGEKMITSIGREIS